MKEFVLKFINTKFFTFHITTLIFILIALMLIKEILYLIKIRYDIHVKRRLLKYQPLSRDFFSENISRYEFQHWCKSLLYKMRYTNLKILSSYKSGDVNIIGTYKNKKVYIYTKLCKLESEHKKNSYERYQLVTKEELEKFVGLMIVDYIDKGIIITTGDFSEDASKYINCIQNNYNIELIDGSNLLNIYRKIRKSEIKKLSHQKNNS